MSDIDFILCAHCWQNYKEGGAMLEIEGKTYHRKCAHMAFYDEAKKLAQEHVAMRDKRGDHRAAFERARAQFTRYPHMLRDLSKYRTGGDGGNDKQ